MDWQRIWCVGVCNGNDGACVCVFDQKKKKKLMETVNENCIECEIWDN